MLAAVVAAASNDVIGDRGSLPWHLPEDLAWFKELTLNHVVLCGRLTHESIVARLGAPLPRRHTVVVSRSASARTDESVSWASTPDAAMATAFTLATSREQDEVFLIGGAAIYEALQQQTGRVYLTRIHASFEGDTSLPKSWLPGFRLQAAVDFPDASLPFTREIYERG